MIHDQIVTLTFEYSTNFNAIDFNVASVGENLNLCGSASCKKKNKVVVPIVASVGGLLVVSLIVVALLWGLKRRRTQRKTDLRAYSSKHRKHSK